MRYGAKGYIYDISSEGTILLHGVKPEIEGQEYLDKRDENGKYRVPSRGDA